MAAIHYNIVLSIWPNKFLPAIEIECSSYRFYIIQLLISKKKKYRGANVHSKPIKGHHSFSRKRSEPWKLVNNSTVLHFPSYILYKFSLLVCKLQKSIYTVYHSWQKLAGCIQPYLLFYAPCIWISSCVYIGLQKMRFCVGLL